MQRIRLKRLKSLVVMMITISMICTLMGGSGIMANDNASNANTGFIEVTNNSNTNTLKGYIDKLHTNGERL